MSGIAWCDSGGGRPMTVDGAGALPESLFLPRSDQELDDDRSIFLRNMPIEFFGRDWFASNLCYVFFASLNLSKLISYSA